MISLRHGVWSATVEPERGGAVASLIRDGVPVLRSTLAGATDPVSFACFPLVPYANRIAHGRFVFEGRQISLPVLPQFAPHALHGDGWLSSWKVIQQDLANVVLGFDGDSEDWPWRYEARQAIELSASGLGVTLSVTNRDSRLMPVGLGLHPYFPCRADSRLTVVAEAVWTGDDIVPDRLARTDQVATLEGQVMSDLPFVDHCYDGWSGIARLIDQDGETIVRSTTGRLHVYVPTGQGYCCLEPVTHRPDVFNQASADDQGFEVLAPGKTLSMDMTIERT